MSHTKGPWEVHPRYPASIRVRGGTANVASVSKRNGLHISNPPEEEAYANAHLIAAAPDLLEALEGMLNMHYRLLEKLPDQEVGFGFASMLIIARDKAKAAIAKATK